MSIDHPTLVLVHGFMDDAAIWDAVRSALTADVATVAVDLAGGCGDPSAAGPFTLARFVDDVARTVDAVAGPVVLVGQSMGTQVVELVAASRPDAVRGLVLLTPIPLAGMHLPADFAAGMKALSSAPVEDQRGARLGLSPGFPIAELDRLIDLGGAVPPSTVSDVLDVWDQGTPAGKDSSAYAGPVLILPGAVDPFATAEVVAAGVTPRFVDAFTTATFRASRGRSSQCCRPTDGAPTRPAPRPSTETPISSSSPVPGDGSRSAYCR